MSRPVRPASLRRSLLGSVATLATVAALAGACSDDGGTGGGGGGGGGEDGPTEAQPVVALDAAQVEKATLSVDNLGAGWAQQPVTPEDEEPGPGCLATIDAATADLEESAKHEAHYAYGDDGLPSVEAGVSAYPDEAAVVEGFDAVEQAIEACDAVTWTEDGYAYSLTLQPDTDIAVDGVDDQNGFTAAGTITLPDGQTSPIHLHLTFLRLGPNVATVATTALDENAASHVEYAKIAADRLVAVAQGEEPPATTAPAV
ncbi:hypothetical protein [Nocardioides sp. SYSU DS0651]|uniref:hypothetical protein n=1 Tax=Nocardioides sp. SYSU DS0651 TaxID=3415955 RepID=UPI003F4B7A1A